MRKHHFWHVQWFEMVKNGGLKKHLSMSILKVWQLTLILAKQDPLGRDQIEKKGFFNTLLMRKHHFWHVQWFWNGQKWGVKKASLYVHFEGLTTDSYFGKTRPPGERSDRKKGFLTLFWWENIISDMSSGFEMVKNGGLKKHLSMSILKVWQLTLILAKQDPLGRDQIEKRLF